MRLPSILDLLDAVTRISRDHPTVTAWRLTPRARLPLRGEPSYSSSAVRMIDLAVESAAEGAPDYRRIERELSGLLPGSEVTVRALRPDERSRMMRLYSPTGAAQEHHPPGRSTTPDEP